MPNKAILLKNKTLNSKQMGKSGVLGYILYSDGDTDVSQNLLGSKLDQDHLMIFSH